MSEYVVNIVQSHLKIEQYAFGTYSFCSSTQSIPASVRPRQPRTLGHHALGPAKLLADRGSPHQRIIN